MLGQRYCKWGRCYDESHTIHFLLYLFIITSSPLTISLTQHTHTTQHNGIGACWVIECTCSTVLKPAGLSNLSTLFEVLWGSFGALWAAIDPIFGPSGCIWVPKVPRKVAERWQKAVRKCVFLPERRDRSLYAAPGELYAAPLEPFWHLFWFHVALFGSILTPLRLHVAPSGSILTSLWNLYSSRSEMAPLAVHWVTPLKIF